MGAALAFVVAITVAELLGPWAQGLATVIMIAASLWSTTPFVTNEGDAGWIVIDEAAGMFVGLLGLGLSPAAFVSFVVFRAADIFKGLFPGVAAAERLDGSLGVTADDLVAGAYGLLAGQAVQFLL